MHALLLNVLFIRYYITVFTLYSVIADLYDILQGGYLFMNSSVYKDTTSAQSRLSFGLKRFACLF